MTAEHQEPEMPRCREAEALIVRAADGSALTAVEEERLERHLQSCAACRAELDDERRVVQTLQARTVTPVPAGFEARLAARLGDASGLLGLANWRAWTVGLLPVAGGLVLMAYFGVGAGTADAPAVVSESASSYTATTPAGMFLQPVSNSDVLLEAVLTGRYRGTRMSDNRVRIWFSLFVLAVFCVGLAAGTIIGRRMGPPPPRGGGFADFGPLGPPPGRPGPPPPMLFDRLAGVLQLTPEQRARLEPIFEARRKRLDAIHDDVAARTEKEQRDFQDEIKKVLTPEQQERFQRWLDEAPRGRRGGRGPGPGRGPR